MFHRPRTERVVLVLTWDSQQSALNRKYINHTTTYQDEKKNYIRHGTALIVASPRMDVVLNCGRSILASHKNDILCIVYLHALHIYCSLLTLCLKQRYEMKVRSGNVAAQVEYILPQQLNTGLTVMDYNKEKETLNDHSLVTR